MNPVLIVIASLAYLVVLFFIAYWTDKQAAKGRSVVNNPYVYSLSLAVYCTAWTFFGSVGKAAQSGIDFLPIYLGPTIAATLWWLVLRKMVVISKLQRITSIADFVSSRYGKSTFLGAFVTIIATICTIPYISIQLKAIALSYDLLTYDGASQWSAKGVDIPFYQDTAWYVTIVLAVFSIFFGTRKLDPNERHEGLVAAVAFESIFKLLSFLVVGIFVTFGTFNGFGDIFGQAAQIADIKHLLFLEEEPIDGWYWFWLILISTFAILFLPRQFHIGVVENTNPNFINQAAWIFPLYLLLINIFVLPIAIGGTIKLGIASNPDMFVLSLPILEGNRNLALFVALGGFSASTSMVIVAITALALMLTNNVVLPLILNASKIHESYLSNIPRRFIGIRRVCVVVVLILAYGYFKFVSAKYALASIGLISFAGVAQFAPAILGGIYWKRATKQGAIAGLLFGFVIWAFCLPMPTLSETSLIPESILTEGLWGIAWLNPYQLFGLRNIDPISNGVFWSLLFNTAAYVIVSLNTKPSPLEVSQADLFVNIYNYQESEKEYGVIRREADVKDVKQLLHRFLGHQRAKVILSQYEKQKNISLEQEKNADEDLIRLAETHLSGSIGAASAKVILNSIVKSDPISLDEMFQILDQTREILKYSKELELKSKALEATTKELQKANQQLKKLDALKADFITTVTHELRTPITSIKALAKILQDNRDLPIDQQAQYLEIVVNESERLARLVNQVLDLEKIQDQDVETKKEWVNLSTITRKAYLSLEQLMINKKIAHHAKIEPDLMVLAEADKLTQAIVNLLSNAIKFCDQIQGKVELTLEAQNQLAILKVRDNGVGISPSHQAFIFEKFAQITNHQLGKPKGTGLGLAITKQIVELHDGTIEVESREGQGATFVITLPLKVYDMG